MTDDPKNDALKKDSPSNDVPQKDDLQTEKSEPGNSETGDFKEAITPEDSIYKADLGKKIRPAAFSDEVVDFAPGEQSREDLYKTDLYKADLKKDDSTKNDLYMAKLKKDEPKKPGLEKVERNTTDQKREVPPKDERNDKARNADDNHVEPIVPKTQGHLLSRLSNRQLITMVACVVLGLLLFYLFNPLHDTKPVKRANNRSQLTAAKLKDAPVSGELLQKLTEQQKIQSNQIVDVNSGKNLNVNLDQLQNSYNFAIRTNGDSLPEFATLATNEVTTSRTIASSKAMAVVCCSNKYSNGLLTEIDFIGESDFAQRPVFYLQEMSSLMHVVDGSLTSADFDSIFGSMGLLNQKSFSATISSKVPHNGITYELAYVPNHPFVFKITPTDNAE